MFRFLVKKSENHLASLRKKVLKIQMIGKLLKIRIRFLPVQYLLLIKDLPSNYEAGYLILGMVIAYY